MIPTLLRRLIGTPPAGAPATPARPLDPAAADLVARWQRDGYLLLEGLIGEHTCDAVLAEVARYSCHERRMLQSLVTIDVLHGAHAGKRMRAASAPEDAFAGPFKINNLFAESQVLQTAVFAPPLLQALATVLGAEPLAINSLNFKFGSQQPAHIDSWYMPPPKANSMAVASICLEDTDPEAGPLFYYPGSHLIPPYVFSHGRLDAVAEEMPACRAYLERELAQRGLQRKLVLGRKGDVFIWHCQLLHGGLPIEAAEKTRASLVVHYWGSDCVGPELIRKGLNGGNMLKRDYVFSDGIGISAA
jgi:phytanoyl-CoA hydroxylase